MDDTATTPAERPTPIARATAHQDGPPRLEVGASARRSNDSLTAPPDGRSVDDSRSWTTLQRVLEWAGVPPDATLTVPREAQSWTDAPTHHGPGNLVWLQLDPDEIQASTGLTRHHLFVPPASLSTALAAATYQQLRRDDTPAHMAADIARRLFLP